MTEVTFTTTLANGQALTVDAVAETRRLVVQRGMLWLTRAGDLDDHWLSAGEGWTLAPGEAVVVEGWPAAEFQLLLPVQVRAAAQMTEAWA
jgi:hypothetical protein